MDIQLDKQCQTCVRIPKGVCDGAEPGDLNRPCEFYKRMTNADRIRGMTAKELALYLAWLSDPDTLIVDYRLYDNDSNVKDMLKWLRQEVI